MKKIIDGFRYDTDKADKVCDICEGGKGDFRHLDCALYCTRRAKRFYLAGFGGAMTVFAHRCTDESLCGWEDIIPLSMEDARRYAEKYANVEQIEKFFKVEEA
jgi:hypothetical protein